MEFKFSKSLIGWKDWLLLFFKAAFSLNFFGLIFPVWLENSRAKKAKLNNKIIIVFVAIIEIFRFSSCMFWKYAIFALSIREKTGWWRKRVFRFILRLVNLETLLNDARMSERGCFLGVLYYYDATSGVILFPYLHHGSPSPTNRDRAKMNGSTLFYCKLFPFEPFFGKWLIIWNYGV